MKIESTYVQRHLVLRTLILYLTREFQIFINKKIYLPNHLVNK